jgi:hypothetical protein
MYERDIAFARSVQFAEHPDSGDRACPSPSGFEFQRFDQCRGEPSRRRVAGASLYKTFVASSLL